MSLLPPPQAQTNSQPTEFPLSEIYYTSDWELRQTNNLKGAFLFVISYKQWLESVYTTLDQWPVNMSSGWENRFAAIDFRGMYRAGFSALEAAELAKSITTFVTYSHRLSKA